MEVTNRFKGLEIVNSVPEELWMEVYNIVQEVANKTIPKKKKTKKVKWLSEEALQIAKEKKRCEKQGKRGKEYPTKCRFPKNSKERQEGFLQLIVYKTTEGERLDIFSGKLWLSREHFAQRWAQ